MAERADDGPEGWRVPQRVPMIAAAAVPLGLLALLSLAGRFYELRLAPPHPAATAFPAPGIETFLHDGVRHPAAPQPKPAPDPAIAAAKRLVIAEGLPGWPAR